MIVLDTNVISELMRAEPDARVMKWVKARPPHALFTTAITAAELTSGLERMADGKRRDRLLAQLKIMLDEIFRDRILAFDRQCAPHFARIDLQRRNIGRRIEEPDGFIAATCARHGFSVATRNVADFSDCGLDVINPWAD